LPVCIIIVLMSIAAALNRLALKLPDEGMVLHEGILGLCYVRNTGMAFSFLASSPTVALVLSALVLCALGAYLFFGKITRFQRVCLSCVFAGGASNLLERIFLGFVPDMIQALFIDFPVFNFADICVCMGVFALLLSIIFTKETVK